jgi:hypothetical protein
MLIIEDLRTKERRWQPSTTGPRGHYNFKPGQIIMKFGEQLRSSVIKEYEWSYIDYDGLKALLKTNAPKGQEKKWTEEKETKFIDALDEQLDRVYTRQKSKAGEIERRIETSRREVDDVVARLDSRGPVGRDGHVENDDAPTEEEFIMLEQDLREIIADVHDLAKFVQINYTGFQKIIKKHDVSLPYDWRGTADNYRKKPDGFSSLRSQLDSRKAPSSRITMMRILSNSRDCLISCERGVIQSRATVLLVEARAISFDRQPNIGCILITSRN